MSIEASVFEEEFVKHKCSASRFPKKDNNLVQSIVGWTE